jgi:transposase-like protein
MEAAKVASSVVKVRCCPRTYPYPTCGRRGRRKTKQPLTRLVRTIAYKQIVYLEIEYAEYRARCNCCKTYRSSPVGVDFKCHYDNKVREAVLDRLLDDRMSVQAVRQALARDFLLDLSEGFVYDCLHREVARLDMAEYRAWTLQHFSGTLCIDELHLGRYTLLLATDPVNDFPVGFALVDRNDQDHMRRFLGNLQAHRLSPKVVITDGSSLYPQLLAELWPTAQHQLCVFHVLQDANRHVLDAVKRLRRELSRRGNGGRKRRRGRPTKAQARSRKRKPLSAKEKTHFVFKHRYLITKRPDNLSPQDEKNLATICQYLPGLRTLRTFVDRIQGLFEVRQSPHQARCRRAKLVGHAEFQRVPELAEAMQMLEPEKFEKMIAFLHRPVRKRIRTNNHVERTNRQLRYFEKVRYKWRQRRSIVRFILLAIRRIHRRCKSELTPPTERSQPCKFSKAGSSSFGKAA